MLFIIYVTTRKDIVDGGDNAGDEFGKGSKSDKDTL